jgi:surface antigen
MKGRMICALILFLAGFAVHEIALADPPDWAPAHGWRNKQHGDDDWREDGERHGKRDEERKRKYRWDREHRHSRYSDYDGRRWPSDYGVIHGDCDRRAIGAVLGGVVGGAVGSRVGRDADRPVAILLGSVIGAVVGAEIGRRMDEQDRACMGHALELADGGHPVMWSNEITHATYILTPMQPFERGNLPCRTFALEVRDNGRRDVSSQQACRSPGGQWQLVGR